MLKYRIISFLGLFLLLGLAWLISENRKNINRNALVWGLGLQFFFALLVLKTGIGRVMFNAARVAVGAVINCSDKGAEFLFGSLVNNSSIGAIVAFKVLPIIIFVSALTAVLYYLRVIQFFVKIMARIMHKTMKISGAESVGAALFVFLGIESVTAIKAYIREMTKSELFTLMCGFMATIATSVMATYASFGADPGHLLAASVMSAPAAIVVAKLMIPEGGTPRTLGEVRFDYTSPDSNVIEAAASGSYDGLKLATQIGAMLLSFIAIIWMLNSALGLLGTSFEKLAGYLFSPFAIIMGIPWEDSIKVGQLLGTKTVFNEFLAYIKLQELAGAGALSPRSIVISTYALCGFANFGSIAILIGGIGGVAANRKKDVAALGLKALAGGTIATFMTACFAGILI